jgi:hypothetical protein
MFGLSWKGMPEVNFAKTVREVANLTDPYAAAIMNRNRKLDEMLVGSIVAQGIMSYEGRNPKPALDADGNFQTTDLDLLSFLAPLAARGAVVEIPAYRNRRQVVRREGERKIGTNRFGRLVGLTSNKEAFSFSVKIFDQTVVSSDSDGFEKVGAYRNLMVVDPSARLYDGWDKIVWKPTAEENSFLKTNRLFTGNTVYFKYFVHPNRWQSVFGAPYLLKKMLLARIDDEAGFYRREVKRLLAAGIRFPDGGKKETKPVTSAGRTRTISVKTMEMSLTLPSFTGKYASVPLTFDGLIRAYRRQKLLTYTWKPFIQFVVRADEAAFMLYGLDGSDRGKIAGWIRGGKWTPWRKTPRSALSYRLVLGRSVALVYRTKLKTERIAA